MPKVVVIDGPAGSGKSTTAIALAKKLGYVYLDTGAMYRALTLKFLNLGIKEYNDEKRIRNILDNTSIEIKPVDDVLHIFLDDIDVTYQIRSNEVDNYVSEISAIDSVRDFMQEKQRHIAHEYNIVAEGRDLGSYVFPDADVKIFLTADLDVRAKRRLLQKNAFPEEFNEFRNNLTKRDRIDSSRKHSPLKKVEDAIVVDTTNLTFDQQVEKIYSICKKKIG